MNIIIKPNKSFNITIDKAFKKANPAIERFCALFGKDCLDALNLTIIPPDDVIMDPKLLKGKI